MAKRFVVRASQGRGWRNSQRFRSSRHCSSLAWGSESRSRQVTNTKRLPSCQWGKRFRQTSTTPGPSSEQPELAIRRFFESNVTYFRTILSFNRREEGRFSYRPVSRVWWATGERTLQHHFEEAKFANWTMFSRCGRGHVGRAVGKPPLLIGGRKTAAPGGRKAAAPPPCCWGG